MDYLTCVLLFFLYPLGNNYRYLRPLGKRELLFLLNDFLAIHVAVMPCRAVPFCVYVSFIPFFSLVLVVQLRFSLLFSVLNSSVRS